MLVIAGLLLAGVGAILWFGGSKGRGGLLPGDIAIERGQFKFYFPIVTCILVSALLTLIFWIFNRR